MSEEELENGEIACDCSGENPFHNRNVNPSKEEVRAAVIKTRGNLTRAGDELGFNSCWHFYHFLKEKNWADEMSKQKNPELKRLIAEEYEKIGVAALIAQARGGNFNAAKKILDDQCGMLGWGSAEKETSAVQGTGKSVAELFGEAEEKTEEK